MALLTYVDNSNRINPDVELARAIGSEFVHRKLNSIALVLAPPTLLLLGVVLWLTTQNVWWWLVAVPIIIFMLFEVIVYLMARMVIKRFCPKLTKSQVRGIASFVDKLERVADNLQTPMIIIVFRVLWDTAAKNQKTFIQSLAVDSKTLKTDFVELQKLFR